VSPAAPAPQATAKPDDVKAARVRLDAVAKATYAPKTGDLLTEIVIPDCSPLTADDVALLGKLTDLKKLQLVNFRALNDEMAAQLKGLTELTSLSLTNSVINNATAEMIVQSFPKLVDLDLSSNTNMTNGSMKILAIRGKNLASLAGEFCVDFQQEPLASSGLFAINGGYHTLQFALYGLVFGLIQ